MAQAGFRGPAICGRVVSFHHIRGQAVVPTANHVDQSVARSHCHALVAGRGHAGAAAPCTGCGVVGLNVILCPAAILAAEIIEQPVASVIRHRSANAVGHIAFSRPRSARGQNRRARIRERSGCRKLLRASHKDRGVGRRRGNRSQRVVHHLNEER